MKNFFRILLAAMIAATPAAGLAGAPDGYYSSCENKCGKSLLQALNAKVSSHTNVGYDGLWSVYETSDIHPEDGTVWDMYSTKHWTVGRNQCGNYSYVGDCYNREHSFPKSWFSNGSPMVSDAFHIYPTDGKVNGQRSNYPYGECSGGTTLPSHNGIKALGRLGTCTFPGYSGTVFEPDDQYKGDFARSYFYMAAAYYERIGSWDSPMLAGNSYPAFSGWALDLLLKWHRQDPVSSKEEARNDAVYARQHNRNPFIDHPELAEHIWGNLKTQNWSASASGSTEITIPAENTTIDMGTVSVGYTKSTTFIVKGTALTSDVSVSIAGNGFSVTPSSIPAATASATDGAKVTVRLNASGTGTHTATLTLRSGTITRSARITANAVDGIYAYPAANVSDRSFTAAWIYAGDELPNGAYTLHLSEIASGEEQTMYVPADEGEWIVEQLSPSTRYRYWLTGESRVSNKVDFTTAGPIQDIWLLYDDELRPQAPAGERSQSYEILVETENITDPITIAVDAPFALSTDKAYWSRAITIDPDENRFYLSIMSDNPGTYSTEITLTSGSYFNDEITIIGDVYADIPFLEDFEADLSGCSTYDGCNYSGTAATWYLHNAGLWESDSKFAHSGRQVLRMGKTANSRAEMTSDKTGGIGRVTLWTSQWSDSEGPATLHIEYSTDGGDTWQQASGSVTVDSQDFKQFAFDVNITGNARIRVVQTEGARFMLDDISITNYTNAGIDGVEADYHSWDAFCRDHRLVIESRCPQHARVYGIDGMMQYDGEIAAGTNVFVLTPGFYIVSVADFTRLVLVK